MQALGPGDCREQGEALRLDEEGDVDVLYDDKGAQEDTTDKLEIRREVSVELGGGGIEGKESRGMRGRRRAYPDGEHMGAQPRCILPPVRLDDLRNQLHRPADRTCSRRASPSALSFYPRKYISSALRPSVKRTYGAEDVLSDCVGGHGGDRLSSAADSGGALGNNWRTVVLMIARVTVESSWYRWAEGRSGRVAALGGYTGSYWTNERRGVVEGEQHGRVFFVY